MLVGEITTLSPAAARPSTALKMSLPNAVIEAPASFASAVERVVGVETSTLCGAVVTGSDVVVVPRSDSGELCGRVFVPHAAAASSAVTAKSRSDVSTSTSVGSRAVTERKPPNVSLESWVDAQIREARDRGEFDDLAGHGKPLPNLDLYDDELWWVKQWLRRENLSFTPPAIALRKAAEDLLTTLVKFPTERAIRNALDELNTSIRTMNRTPPVDGPPSNLMPLDVEAVVQRWREARALLMAAEAAATDVEVVEPRRKRRRRGLFRRTTRSD
jgi:hypothetical protein